MPDDYHPIVPRNSGALVTTTGAQGIASRMAEDVLDLARTKDLATQQRHRIGEYEFRTPDYEQLQRWARALGITSEEVVAKLAVFTLLPEPFRKEGFGWPIHFDVQDGAIIGLTWDFDQLLLTDWEWVEGLQIRRLGIRGKLPQSQLPLLPEGVIELDIFIKESCLNLSFAPTLRILHCELSDLTSLDLTPVPGLTELCCGHNKLTQLDLTPVPGLTELCCGQNKLTHLDLTPVPKLTLLECFNNELTQLDVTPVPELAILLCDSNQITHLDLTPVPKLVRLDCDHNFLTQLELISVPKLTTLLCEINQLTYLDLTPLLDLKWFECDATVHIVGQPPN